MKDTIVIDFGTTHTKAAYLHPQSGPYVLRLGNRDAIPSLFYVRKDKKILIGNDAEEIYLREDPIGIINLDKRKLHFPVEGQTRRMGNEQSSATLLTLLFKHVRKMAKGVPSLANSPLKTCVLTATALHLGNLKQNRNTLEAAAKEAGFESVAFCLEPEAAARHWAAGAAKTEAFGNDVIVLDLGGGTVDWAHLHRKNSDTAFELNPDLDPDAVPFGGKDVDAKLLDLTRKKLARLGKRPAESIYVQNRQQWLRDARYLKERYCREGSSSYSIKLSDWKPVEFEGTEIQEVIDNTLIERVCKKVKPFIEQVKEMSGSSDGIPTLLVGGSSQLKGLREQLETLGCKTIPSWDQAEFAVVLGAVPIPQEQETAQPSQPETHPRPPEVKPEPAKTSAEKPNPAPAENRKEQGSADKTSDKQRDTEHRKIPPNNGEDERKERNMNQDDLHHRIAEPLRYVGSLIGRREAGHFSLNLINPAQLLLDKAAHLKNPFLEMAFVGSVSRGKSTLVNALLGEKLLPMHTQPRTGVISKIVYAECQGSTVELVMETEKKASKPKTQHTSRHISREEFSKLGFNPYEEGSLDKQALLPMPPQLAEIAHAVVETTNPLCKQGISLVDTLGLNIGKEAPDKTFEYLPEAHMVVMILNGIPLADNDDKELLELVKQADPRSERIFFVINDKGLYPDQREEVWAAAKSLLHPCFSTDADFKSRVHLINTRAALEAKLALKAERDEETVGQLEEQLAATGLLNFEREIQAFLKPDALRADIVRDAVEANFLPTCSVVKRALEDRKTQFSKKREEVVAELTSFQEVSDERQKRVKDLKRFCAWEFVVIRDKIGQSFKQWVSDTIHPELETLAQAYYRWHAKDEDGRLEPTLDTPAARRAKVQILGAQASIITKLSEWSKTVLEEVKPDAQRMLDAVRTRLNPLAEGGMLELERLEYNVSHVLSFQELERALIQKVLGKSLKARAVWDGLSLGIVAVIRVAIRNLTNREKLDPVKRRLERSLEKELASCAREIVGKVEDVIQTQVDLMQEQFKEAIEIKQSNEKQVAKEREKLDKFEKQFTEKVEEVCLAYYGRVLTEAELSQKKLSTSV